jgi:HEAT repeat protein
MTDKHQIPWTRMALRNRDERGKLNSVGRQQDWTMAEVIQASDERMFEIIWLTKDEQTRISYIQDDILGLDLFFAIGPAQAEAAEKLQEKADIISHKDALDFAEKASTNQERIQAAYILAATASYMFNKRAFDILERLADSDDAPTRHAVAITIGYLGWDELVPLLGKLAKDENEKVRESAKSCQKYWPPYTRV